MKIILSNKCEEEFVPEPEDLTHINFKKMFKLYLDERRLVQFPKDFDQDNFFLEAYNVYRQIGENEYLKSVILKPWEDQGLTHVDLINNEPEITISISPYKIGIIAGSVVKKYQTFVEFRDVFAHELFHAQSNCNIINKYGVAEYKSIKDDMDMYTMLARIEFDEYIACRKNAEMFQSFDTIETLDSAETFINNYRAYGYPICLQKFLYCVATHTAFAEVSQNYIDKLSIEKYKLKDIFFAIKKLFNEAYGEVPLNHERYKMLGLNLKSIIEL